MPRDRRGQAHEVRIPCLRTLCDKIVSQNAPDCTSVPIHFKNFPGAMPLDAAGSSRPLAARDFSSKRSINRTLPCHRSEAKETLKVIFFPTEYKFLQIKKT